MSRSIADHYTERFGESRSNTSEDLSDNEQIRALLNHRSHRRFKPDPIPENTLETLLACAYSAPSKSDLQQASVIRVLNEDKREAISSLIPNMPWISSAPEFMVVCGDSRRIRQICNARGKPFANDHLDAFFNATVDAALVMQNLIVASEAIGLGCCPISVIRNHATAVTKLLQIPNWVFPIAGLCLGYPLEQAHISMRLPLSVTVHIDSYDDMALTRNLDRYDKRRDKRFSIPVDKQRYAAGSDPLDFYGWSEDKARQVSEPERDDFGKFVRGQGFILD